MVGFLTFNRRQRNRHGTSPVNKLIPTLTDSATVTAA